MATQALININNEDAPNVAHLDVPINVEVQLGNHGLGDESTYLWTVLDQPPGTEDTLSSTTIHNPTITPKKEGTYLLELIVDEGLSTQKRARAVFAVLDIKTRERIPVAGERTEASTTRGWAAAMNAALTHALASSVDNNIVVAEIAGNNSLNPLTAVRFSGYTTLKESLPGEERVLKVLKATANDLGATTQSLGVILNSVDGSVAPAAPGTLVNVRVYGPVFDGFSFSSSPGNDYSAYKGQDVHLLDDGTIGPVSIGTNARAIGTILDIVEGPAGVYTVSYFFDGGQLPNAQQMKVLLLSKLPSLSGNDMPSMPANADVMGLVNNNGELYASLGGPPNDEDNYKKILSQNDLDTLQSQVTALEAIKPTAVVSQFITEDHRTAGSGYVPIFSAEVGRAYRIMSFQLSAVSSDDSTTPALAANDTNYVRLHFETRDSSGVRPSFPGGGGFGVDGSFLMTSQSVTAGGTGDWPNRGCVHIVPESVDGIKVWQGFSLYLLISTIGDSPPTIPAFNVTARIEEIDDLDPPTE